MPDLFYLSTISLIPYEIILSFSATKCNSFCNKINLSFFVTEHLFLQCTAPNGSIHYFSSFPCKRESSSFIVPCFCRDGVWIPASAGMTVLVKLFIRQYTSWQAVKIPS